MQESVGILLPRSDLSECAKVNYFIGRLVRFALRTVPQDFSFCKISAKLELHLTKSPRPCSHIKYPEPFEYPVEVQFVKSSIVRMHSAGSYRVLNGEMII